MRRSPGIKPNFFLEIPEKKKAQKKTQRTNYHPTDKYFEWGITNFPPSEVEIRLENGKNTANTLEAFFPEA